MTTQTAPAQLPHTQASSVPGAPPARRSLLVDVLKGLAILLVTLGHTNQSMLRDGAWQSGFGAALDRFIYAFHMPAFFFSTGIFLRSSLEKRGLRHFVTSRVKTLLWPYLVWGAVLLQLVPVFAPRLVHAPQQPARALVLAALTANAQWFLPSLFVASVVAALLVPRVPMPVLFAASWAVSLFWYPLDVAFLDRSLTLLPFLLAGLWLGPRFGYLESMPRWHCLPLAAVLVYLLVIATTPWGLQPLYWGFVPAGLLGTLLLLLVARLLADTAAARFIAWLGVASLGIFLLSPFGQGIGRVLARAAHLQNPFAVLALATLLATLPAAWIYQHRERLRIGWMFVFPR